MKSKKLLYNLSRWLMALLFVFSGVAKSLNPFGLSVQLGDYLTAFGLSSLKVLAATGAVLLPSLEMLLGVMVAMNLGRRVARWGVLLSMCFFTGLTLWIALTNPVSDCGCFGDLLKLTNWETFFKNVVLLPFAVIYFWLSANDQSGRKSGWRWYLIAVPISFALALYSSFNLPLVDATPFKVGVNVLDAMTIPQGAARDEVRTILIYRNKADGTEREFDINDLEWQDDSKWEYVDTRTQVVTEGYRPAIKSLPMINVAGEDVSTDVLSYPGRVVLLVTNHAGRVNMEALSSFVQSNNARGVMLTSESLGSWARVDGVECYNSDYSVISTVVQHYDGGVVILENGVIVDKIKITDID